VTRCGGFVLETVVTDLSLEGCCLQGFFQPREIIELVIRSIGRFRAQVQWVKYGRAGARFLNSRAAQHSAPAAPSRSLLRDARGVAAIEYAFLASLIAVSLVASFTILGASVAGYFASIASAVEQSLGTSYHSGDPQP
jgi:Flp pilus assembly pilin Flp